MSTIQKSGILSKVFVCPCGCEFKIKGADIKKAGPVGRCVAFFCAIGILQVADSYVECRECYRRINFTLAKES